MNEMIRYPLILQALADFCDRYNLTQTTKATHIGDANRILESVVAGLSEQEILELMQQQGFKINENSSYPSIIRTLKSLIAERPRQ